MTYKVIVDSKNPPTDALIVLEVINSQNKEKIEIIWCNDWKDDGNIRLTDSQNKVLGKRSSDVSRYFARTTCTDLYGGVNPREKTEVDHWLSFAIGPLEFYPLKEDALSYLDNILLTNTWLVSKKLTIADIHVFCTLVDKKFLTQFEKKFINITRWYKQVLSLSAVTKALLLVKKNAKLSLHNNVQSEKTINKQTGQRKQEGKFIDLPGAEMGRVIVRFPPEASGYLHIGHAKAALLNQYYAQTFQGQFIMRFDDTNPAKENVEFEKAILEDLELLQIKPDRFTHSSDYFDLMLEYCTKLIKDGKAYVDNTPADIMKEQRDQKLMSSNRNNSIEQNLELWNEMQQGTVKGQECCVRAKIDYQSTNGCLRDPTIYRCKPEPHPRTGTKYKVYPIYDFACPIVDAVENVTHTLRTTEYHDRDVQFYWIIDALGLRRPYIWEYSRLNMTHTVLSKRKLTWFVDQGLVDGWDDPRFPTVRGILRRGMTVEGLKQFIIAQGSSKSVVFMEWDKIWAFNKKVIDPVATRYTALEYNKIVPVHIDDAKEEWLTVQNHPKDISKGTKQVLVGSQVYIERDDANLLTEGQNATFINWGNILIKKIERENDVIKRVVAQLNLENKDYKNTLKITWLSIPSDKNHDVSKVNLIPCYAVYFDHIISKSILGKDDDYKDFIAKNTRTEIQMLGEVALKHVEKGEIIQLQRKGFFRCDVSYAPVSPFSSREQPLILFQIPDGHTTNITKSIPTGSTLASVKEISQKNKQTLDANLINEKIVVQLEEIGTPGTTLNKSQIISDENKLSENTLSENIIQQESRIKKLQLKINQEMQQLLNLKTEYKNKTGNEWTGVKNQNITKDILTESHAVRLYNEIQKQGDKVRQLKSSKAEKGVIDEEVKKLLALKSDYKSVTGQDWKPSTIPTIDITNKEENSADKISESIQKQGDNVRQLKSSKAEKSVIDQEIKILLDLKNNYKALTGQEWKSIPDMSKKKKEDISKREKQNTSNKEINKNESMKDVDIGKTRLGLEARKEENFFEWYSQIITKSGMIEYYDVSGCYVYRPWSFAVWKMIKEYIDKEITQMGVQECYFPMFVTRTVLEKEKKHIADFAPEVAWVTKCGESDLAEPIAIRPTSETVMYPAYAKWLKSDTELPLKLNQWNNVVRWEFKDPKPFLRTREFLWQEGHSAFATKAEADEEVMIILDLYARVYEDLLAIPVVKGRKTEKEKFAGGDYTTTVEAFISTSGRAIQGATSHHLGQNFSKMFNIQVENAVEGNEKTFVYQNSWGLTTRTIGVMIMVHGDDKGLVLPPNVACIQAIIVPCGITASTTPQQRELLFSECNKLLDELSKDSLRVKADYRSNRTPGWKFNHWELKGVPVRIEVGPKDLNKNQVTFVRRDNSERVFAKRPDVVTALHTLLTNIQADMLSKAKKNLNEHIKRADNWNEFCSYLNEKNILLSPFCGESSCEDKIKRDSAREDTGGEIGTLSMGAKSLCIPFEQPPSSASFDKQTCIHPDCQNKPQFYTLFGRSY
uniref:bifunctional glutamate/proline--tRNA ligase isoform X2 n=1 Tax=Bombus vancouverensis nearcticus TaxID=2705178 RepID=UPI00143BBE50|nr:bifunctional glutamate/proline--tRNA ligase isoform X2 [Bombus vancouverensis nearcticus]